MNELEVSDVTVEYSSGGYRVRPLDGVNLAAADGELVVLLGPSGCGKTTLLSCLAGLLTPTSGTIRFRDEMVGDLQGRALSQFRRHTVGVVFQAFNLIPSLSALGNVVAPLRLAGVSRSQARAKAHQLLDQVGMSDRLRHRPGRLSGGQQQRVAIARALVHDPPLILADEPTAHLDHIQVEGILRLVRDLAAPGRVVVVATHDDRVSNLADRVVELVPRGSRTDSEPEPVALEPGATLFRQGDRGELVYVVDHGEIELVRELADGTEERITTVGSGAYFGELGPMLNLPRSATARASTTSHVTGFGLRAFRQRFPGTAAGPPPP